MIVSSPLLSLCLSLVSVSSHSTLRTFLSLLEFFSLSSCLSLIRGYRGRTADFDPVLVANTHDPGGDPKKDVLMVQPERHHCLVLGPDKVRSSRTAVFH